jgi:hypothetical protein
MLSSSIAVWQIERLLRQFVEHEGDRLIEPTEVEIARHPAPQPVEGAVQLQQGELAVERCHGGHVGEGHPIINAQRLLLFGQAGRVGRVEGKIGPKRMRQGNVHNQVIIEGDNDQ